MPFGKHIGTPVEEVPVDYLEWMLAKFEGLRDPLKSCIEEHLASLPPRPAKSRAAKSSAAKPQPSVYDEKWVTRVAAELQDSMVLAEFSLRDAEFVAAALRPILRLRLGLTAAAPVGLDELAGENGGSLPF